MGKSNWEKHEADVQELLGLDSTIASGTKWYDQGDATSNTNPQDDQFPIMLDCKATIQKSYSMDKVYLNQWRTKALLLGKRFLLPVRFVDDEGEHDWCVVPLGDLAELLDQARRSHTPVEKDEELLPQEVDEGLEDLYQIIKEVKDPSLRLKSLEQFEAIEKYVRG